MCSEIRYKIDDVNKVNYEFECEALADFKYGQHQNQLTEDDVIEKFKNKLQTDFANLNP